MFQNLVRYSPDDPPGGAPAGTASGQVDQQQAEKVRLYDQLQQQIKDGKLVEPGAFVKQKIDAGELFPKDRFAGLQSTFQTTQETLNNLQKQHDALKLDFSNLEKDVTDKSNVITEKEAEIGKLTKVVTRSKVIIGKFPALAPFEAEGLLPDAPEDQLETVFGAFLGKLDTLKQKATNEYLEGGIPPTPLSKPELKKEGAQAHLKLANAALAKGDTATYNAEYDLYLAGLGQAAK